jgi:hypothetical protein
VAISHGNHQKSAEEEQDTLFVPPANADTTAGGHNTNLADWAPDNSEATIDNNLGTAMDILATDIHNLETNIDNLEMGLQTPPLNPRGPEPSVQATNQPQNDFAR